VIYCQQNCVQTSALVECNAASECIENRIEIKGTQDTQSGDVSRDIDTVTETDNLVHFGWHSGWDGMVMVDGGWYLKRPEMLRWN